MAELKKAFRETMKWEGGYVNDPNDRGGETNFGISKRSFPHVNIKELTEEIAEEIYRWHYWNRIQGDKIHNQDVANAIFDAAVNFGVYAASLLVQKAVKAKQDGYIGPITLGMLNSFDPVLFLGIFAIERAQRYLDICEARPNQKRFLKGWLRRAFYFIERH